MKSKKILGAEDQMTKCFQGDNMYSKNSSALKQSFECSNFLLNVALRVGKLTKKDNILICFSKTLTYFCDLEEKWNEPVSLSFEERIKGLLWETSTYRFKQFYWIFHKKLRFS